MTKVRDLMIKNVVKASLKERVIDAAKKMKETGVSSLVVTEGNKVRGIITRSDFIDRVVAEAKNPNTTLVEDIMTKDVLTIDANASIIDALKLMNKYKYSQLPVVDKGELVGIIAIRDALNYIAKLFTASGWGQT